MFRTFATLFFLLPAALQALTVDQINAHHDGQNFGYRVQEFTVDDALRAEFAHTLLRRPPEVRDGVLAALEGRFDSATIHVFRHDITTVDTSITAFVVDGEVVLLSFTIILFFEREDVAAAQIALFDDILQSWDAEALPSGFAEAALGTAIERAQAYHGGDRSGPYPGWYFQDTGPFVSLGFSNIPDYVTVTVTTITDCPPRYPMDGWALLFLCQGR